jgi:two-component system sensor histidine kinase RegB
LINGNCSTSRGKLQILAASDIKAALPVSDLSGFANPPRPVHAEDRNYFLTDPTLGREGMSLRTLVLTRWLGVAGQTAAVLFVRFILEFDIKLGPCLAAIAASAWFNIFLMIAMESRKRAGPAESTLHIGFDIVQFSALLGLTGGLQNPFLLMLIAPVTISAAVLSPRYTFALTALTFSCVALLAVFAAPLPWKHGQTLQVPFLYQAGFVIAFLTGIIFTAVYAWRVAEEESRLRAALGAAEAAMAREQKISALGGLAAAAAHELGTPLATIQVTAKEMTKATDENTLLGEDARLILSQAQRCRDILRKLSERGSERDVMHERLPAAALIEEVASPYRGRGALIRRDLAPRGAEAGPEPVLKRSPEILHGLGNLIENATDHALSEVEVSVRWSKEFLDVTVRDDGPGFAPEVLTRLGEPYVSTRVGPDGEGQGLGLGFFIAKTMLERSGGKVTFRNRPPPHHGAVVRIVWPRRIVEAD